MAGFVSLSRWLVVLWAVVLLSGRGVVAATHTQTVALTVQGMV